MGFKYGHLLLKPVCFYGFFIMLDMNPPQLSVLNTRPGAEDDIRQAAALAKLGLVKTTGNKSLDLPLFQSRYPTHNLVPVSLHVPRL